MAETKVKQIAQKESNVIQIAQQNIQNGLTLDDALKIANDLFDKNFPVLVDKANECIKQRVEELKQELINTCSAQQLTDFSAFEDPDLQFALYKAQQNYARFGKKENLSLLCNLLVSRIKKNNEDMSIKIALDNAIKIAPFLSESHLDFLALTFLSKQVKLGIKTKSEFLFNMTYIAKSFPNAKETSWQYLLSLNCLELVLGDADERLKSIYDFMKDEEFTLPKIFNIVSADHGTSHIGTILAIAHIESKTAYSLNPKTWIQD